MCIMEGDHCSEILVQDVNRENFEQHWPSIIRNINDAEFIALDTEMTGLGSKDGMRAKSIEDRYAALSTAAQSRGIVSLGISAFITRNDSGAANNDKKKNKKRTDGKNESNGKKRKYESEEDNKEEHAEGVSADIHYNVHTYNIYLFCTEPYTVEPASLEFLTNNGFDFNKQISTGVGYYPGADKADFDTLKPHPRRLFQSICESGATLILHNGFIDLIFLYQGLYADLPSNLQTFICDIHSLCVGGIMDTKYIADYHTRDTASFLEYLFRKRLREGVKSLKKGNPRINVTFIGVNGSKLSLDSVEELAPRDYTNQAVLDAVCESYAFHGNCSFGGLCTRSHDIDLFLYQQENPHSKKRVRVDSQVTNKQKDSEENPISPSAVRENQPSGDSAFDEQLATKERTSRSKKRRERRKAKLAVAKTTTELTAAPTPVQPPLQKPTIYARYSHRAGFDAFMTGFIYANDHLRYDKHTLETYKNLLHLSFKDIPLKVLPSMYTKVSDAHKQKQSKNR